MSKGENIAKYEKAPFITIISEFRHGCSFFGSSYTRTNTHIFTLINLHLSSKKQSKLRPWHYVMMHKQNHLYKKNILLYVQILHRVCVATRSNFLYSENSHSLWQMACDAPQTHIHIHIQVNTRLCRRFLFFFLFSFICSFFRNRSAENC